MNAGDDSNSQNWERLEHFVKEKAREYRTEKLKRGHDSVSPAEACTPVNYASRTILKVKRKK